MLGIKDCLHAGHLLRISPKSYIYICVSLRFLISQKILFSTDELQLAHSLHFHLT